MVILCFYQYVTSIASINEEIRKTITITGFSKSMASLVYELVLSAWTFWQHTKWHRLNLDAGIVE
jgi:hypothetical protein